MPEQAGNTAGRAEQGNVVSICTVIFERATTALEADFIRWNATTGFIPLAPEGCRRLLRLIFESYSEQTSTPRATEPESGFLRSALRELEAMLPAEAGDLARVASAYLEFLFDTGQWSGSRQSHAEALAAVGPGPLREPAENPEDPPGHEILLPEIVPEALDAALLDSGFARRFTAMAAFIAPGRDITGTRVLKLKDVPAVAACLGLSARQVGRSVELAATPLSPERRKGSMGSIEEIMRVWELFGEMPLLDWGRTRVRCNSEGLLLVDGPATERARVLRRIATAYFKKSISGEHLVILRDLISPFLLELLLAAGSAAPPLAAAAWEGDFSLPGVPNIPSSFLAQLVHRELLRVQADGLVEVGEFITVPGHLRQCLSDALEELLSEKGGAGGHEGVPWGPGPARPYVVGSPGAPHQ